MAAKSKLEKWSATKSKSELDEISKKIQVWLGHYTDEVIRKVFDKIPEIVDDEFSMNLINELYTRTLEEREDESRTIEMYLCGVLSPKDSVCHCHPITHAKSYRDILYDMYIRNLISC